MTAAPPESVTAIRATDRRTAGPASGSGRAPGRGGARRVRGGARPPTGRVRQERDHGEDHAADHDDHRDDRLDQLPPTLRRLDHAASIVMAGSSRHRRRPPACRLVAGGSPVLPRRMTDGGCRDAPPSVAGSVQSAATGASGRGSVPRMARMPATMDGARFVRRDAAFIRLAPALEEAAGGEATAVLLDGPGGVGVSRFVGEVARRVGGLTEPFTVVRGRSYRPGADEPYGPIVRALHPIFRDVDDDELVRIAGPALED